MGLMDTYDNKLTDAERAAVESALDTLKDELPPRSLCMSDGAARAAEALAVYIVESRTGCATDKLAAALRELADATPTPLRNRRQVAAFTAAHEALAAYDAEQQPREPLPLGDAPRRAL